jgi:hypothetical protein
VLASVDSALQMLPVAQVGSACHLWRFYMNYVGYKVAAVCIKICYTRCHLKGATVHVASLVCSAMLLQLLVAVISSVALDPDLQLLWRNCAAGC